MATKDGFDPDDSLPLFLTADEPEQPVGISSWRFATASILVATATVIGISIPLVGNRVMLFADVTASPVDKSTPQPGTDESTPTIQSTVIQSTADAEALSPTALDAPTRDIGASEPASQTRAENSEASSEALFKEFQAWKAEQDARDLAKPGKDDPAPVAENAPASVRPMQKQRRARAIRSARAEMIRHVRERRSKIRRQNEPVQARSVQDARAQTQSVQYAEPPSFLERLNPFGASPSR
jgi:hypothetical protein